MATLEIPDEVYATLAERARMNGRSVVEQALAEKLRAAEGARLARR